MISPDAWTVAPTACVCWTALRWLRARHPSATVTLPGRLKLHHLACSESQETVANVLDPIARSRQLTCYWSSRGSMVSVTGLRGRYPALWRPSAV